MLSSFTSWTWPLGASGPNRPSMPLRCFFLFFFFSQATPSKETRGTQGHGHRSGDPAAPPAIKSPQRSKANVQHVKQMGVCFTVPAKLASVFLLGKGTQGAPKWHKSLETERTWGEFPCKRPPLPPRRSQCSQQLWGPCEAPGPRRLRGTAGRPDSPLSRHGRVSVDPRGLKYKRSTFWGQN